MMKANKRTNRFVWMLLTVALALTFMSGVGPAYGQQVEGVAAAGSPSGDEPLATITFASGAVGVWQDGGDRWAMVQGTYPLFMGDHVRTGEDSRAVITFADASEVLMHEQTTLQITPRSSVDEPKGVAARVKVSLGRIFNRITPEQSDLEFETPDAVAAIRGTEFFVTVGPPSDAFVEGVRRQVVSIPLTPEEGVEFLSFLGGRAQRLASEGRIDESVDKAVQDVIGVVIQSPRLIEDEIRTVVGSVVETVGRALAEREGPERDVLADNLSEEQRRILEGLEQGGRDLADREGSGGLTLLDLVHMAGRLDDGMAGAGVGGAAVLEWAAAFLEQKVSEQTGGLSSGFGVDSPAPLGFEQVHTLAEDLGGQLETLVLVLTGRVEVFNDFGGVLVNGGERTTVTRGQIPAEPMPANPEEIQDGLTWVEGLGGAGTTEESGDGETAGAPDGDAVFIPLPGEGPDGDDPGDADDPVGDTIDVAVTLDVEPVEAYVGDRVAFQIAIQNAGEEALDALSLRVTLPSGFVLDEDSMEAMDEAFGDAWVIGLPGSPLYEEGSTDEPFVFDVAVVSEEVPLPSGDYVRIITFDADIGPTAEGPGVYAAEAYTYVAEPDEPLHTPSVATVEILESSPTTMSLSGRVVYEGMPVSGQSVALLQWEPGQSAELDEPTIVARTATNSQGEYTLSVPPGEYRIALNDNYPGGPGVPAFVNPRIGDVMAWLSDPIYVEDDNVDGIDIDLGIGHGLNFRLSLAMSEWSGSPGGPVEQSFAGGASAGDDTFVLHLDDVVNADNPLTVTWSFDSAMLDGLGGVAGATVAVIDREQNDTFYPVESIIGDEHTAHLLAWPPEDSPLTARLALGVQLEGGGIFWSLGPIVDVRNTPIVEGVDPVHVVHGDGGQLSFTLVGENLDLVDTLWYSVSAADVSGQMSFEVESDGSTMYVSFPWSLLDGVFGVYRFELTAGPDPEWIHEVEPALLVTSTDLSGAGPGAVPQRGDLHRSATGDGPMGEVAWESWGNPDMMMPLVKAPQFVGQHVILQESADGSVLIYTMEGAGPEWYGSNHYGPLTVASFGDGAGRVLYGTDLSESGFHGIGIKDPGQADEPTGLYEVYSETVHDVLVHDGIGVAVLDESGIVRVVTFDAAEPGVIIAERELDFSFGSDAPHRLAISAGSPTGPRVFVAGGQEVWSGDLHTLGDEWFIQEGGSIHDFAVRGSGDELYVLQQQDGGVDIVAYDGLTGEPRWHVTEEEVTDGTQQPGLYSSPGGLAVHPNGQLYVLAYRDGQTVLMEIDQGTVTRVAEGPSYEDDGWGLHIGLGLATNSNVLYGFVSGGGDGETFKVKLAEEGSDSPEGLSIEPVLFGESPTWGGTLKFMTVARDMVWVVANISEGDVVFRLVGTEGVGGVIDPPLVKRADKTTAQIGDVITYTITFDNTRLVDDEIDLVDQENVWIQDVLPPGFVFVEGSGYVHPAGSGSSAPVPLAPADSSSGRTLQFELTGAAAGGVIPRDTVRTLTYQAVVGPRVVEGAVYTNEAVGYLDGPDSVRGVLEWNNLCGAANPADPVTNPGALPPDCDFILTNVARADVRIVPGVFTMQGIVTGKVFLDIDGDGFQGPGEPGVAGARIVMETGVSVITDSFGKFSLSNLTPGLHVFMLDESSVVMPEDIGRNGASGAEAPSDSDIQGQSVSASDVAGLQPISEWIVRDGASRLVDLAGGGLFTINFVLQPSGEGHGGNDEGKSIP